MSEEFERRLSDLYRAGAQEEPPARLDRTILAAARRPTLLTSWGVPLAAAAVLVLTVSMIFVGRDELPQAPTNLEAQREPAAARIEPQQPRASADALVASKQNEPQARPKGDASEFAKRPDAEILAEERDAPRAARERAKQEAGGATRKSDASANDRQVEVPPPASIPAAPPPPRSDTPEAAGESRKSTGQGRSEQYGSEPAADAKPSAAKPQSAPVPLSKQTAPTRQLGNASEAASPAEQSLSPEQWLRQIEALFKAGKDVEARSSLAEFRKRYPQYPLPEALK